MAASKHQKSLTLSLNHLPYCTVIVTQVRPFECCPLQIEIVSSRGQVIHGSKAFLGLTFVLLASNDEVEDLPLPNDRQKKLSEALQA